MRPEILGLIHVRAQRARFWGRAFSGAVVVGFAAVLAGCGPADPSAGVEEPPIRGLLTTTVNATEETVARRYPGVLEPIEITSLSFEVAGRLGNLDLSVGQRVKEGQTLARLGSEQFQIEIENRAAAVDEAEATLAQDQEDFQRAAELLKRGAGTRVQRDDADADLKRSRAQLRQAEKSLASAQEDLSDSVLESPFDGILNTVDVDPFATVSAGQTITSLYASDAYEVSFSVNFDTVKDLVVGSTAKVRLADDPDIVLQAVVSELGERADTVSSFPVVVELQEVHSILKAGMAVEVAFEFQLPTAEGYLIPITAAVMENDIPEGSGPRQASPIEMYIYDPDAGVVRRRTVVMAGIRGNSFLVIEGLEPGEKVAIAGVAFLRDGMEVNPIDAASAGWE
ncbi:MAG: efflux RND transporter periplasmic adaptor subunit [Rhodobacteraceae bacterium]|nr:efflux RND transporter periplasmic adaptor subunit [Paracoccaceae bacterium]